MRPRPPISPSSSSTRFTLALLAAALCVGVGTAGCRRLLPKRGGPTAAPAAPPTLVWSDNAVELKEVPGARGSFLISKTLGYDVSFYGLPAGTTLSVDGVRVGAGSSVSWTSDVGELLGAVPPSQALDYKFKLDPKKTAELAFTSGAKVAFPLPALAVSYGVGEALKGSIDRPVVFGKGDATKPTAHSVVFFSPTPEVLGPARVLSEVDWVAIEGKGSEPEGKVCTGYKKTGSSAGPERSYRLKLVDQTVTVVERTSSKVIAKREFKAKDECPMMAFSGEAKSYARSDEIKEWLRALRASTK